MITNTTQQNTKPEQKLKKRSWGTLIFWSFAFSMIAGVLLYTPVANEYTLSSADQSMMRLADNAGMNREGKLVFLKTRPQIVDTKKLHELCGDNNLAEGTFEDGCYTSDNRIYIRDMAKDFDSEEVVTAAHEMLHAVYYTLTFDEQDRINELVKNYYENNKLPRLKETMGYYKIEKDSTEYFGELHAFLGSEYDNLPSELEAHYSEYFVDRSLVINAKQKGVKKFKDYENRLTKLEKQISKLQTEAEELYNLHSYYADIGNGGLADSYYNTYLAKHDQASNTIDKYNELYEAYEALYESYNTGAKSFAPIESEPAGQ